MLQSHGSAKEQLTDIVIAGSTRNPMNNAQIRGDCGSEAAMTSERDQQQ
jgi:hypothetical protein